MKAIFIDKDGTLINDVPYNVNPALVELSDGAGEALALLQRVGYKLFVVTNQPGIAKGFFSDAEVQQVEHHLGTLLAANQVALDGFYYCPHHPDGMLIEYAVECGCRKPMPGMLLRAAEEHQIDLSMSWMIGDILHDVEAGKRAGCRTILIDNGNETEWDLSPERTPKFIVPHLRAAALTIANMDVLDDLACREGHEMGSEKAAVP